MRPDGILIRYAEVGTKGNNRRGFINRLAQNARRALGDELLGLDIYSGRLWLYPKEVFSAEALARLERVPGISSFSPARRCDATLEAMQKTALELAQPLTYASFRVRSRRVFKELPLGSAEVDRAIGAFMLQHKPAKVQMKGADVEIGVDMLPQGASCSSRSGAAREACRWARAGSWRVFFRAASTLRWRRIACSAAAAAWCSCTFIAIRS
jgi:thiamine biosynthesis protein ThiI